MTLHVIAKLYIALPELGIVSLNMRGLNPLPQLLKGGGGGEAPSAPLFLCHRLYKARMRLFVSKYNHENTIVGGACSAGYFVIDNHC